MRYDGEELLGCDLLLNLRTDKGMVRYLKLSTAVTKSNPNFLYSR